MRQENEAEGKKARGQKEPREIKNDHGDEERHFIILRGIIRVYFFYSPCPPIISVSSFLSPSPKPARTDRLHAYINTNRS